MASGDTNKEGWQEYKTMADNLLTLAAKLPKELQQKALSDLKQRLPSEVNISSPGQTNKPKRRGRPPKSQQKASSLKTVPMSDSLVIKTRQQRLVELYGDQAPPIKKIWKISGSVNEEKVYKKKENKLKKGNSKNVAKEINIIKNTDCPEMPRIYERDGKKLIADNLNVIRLDCRNNELTESVDANNAVIKENAKRKQDSAMQDAAKRICVRSTDPKPLPKQFKISINHNCTPVFVQSGSIQSKLQETAVSAENLSVYTPSISTRTMITSATPRKILPKISTEQSGELSSIQNTHVKNTNVQNIQSSSLLTGKKPYKIIHSTVRETEHKPTQVVILKKVKHEVTVEEFEYEATDAVHETSNVQENKVRNCSPVKTSDETKINVKNDKSLDRRRKHSSTYGCPECSQKFATRDLAREHLKAHRSDFKCDICGRRFVFKHTYDAHIAVHERGDFHKCPHCANLVKGRDRLEEHIRQRHDGLVVAIATHAAEWPKSSVDNPKLSTPIGPIIMSDNGPTFKAQPHSSATVNEAVGESSLFDRGTHQQRRKIRQNSMMHKCLECGKIFRSSQKLQIHKREDHEKLPTICPICNRRFAYRSSYDLHIADHDAGLLKMCSYGDCMFHYKEDRERERHEKRVHRNDAERAFSCPECNKSFWEERYLKQHLKNHDKTKKYVCEACNFETFNLFSLRRHLLTRHEMTVAHVCDLCGAKLRSKSILQDHIRRHFNERNCICEICKKAFINRSQLAMHMRIHRPSEFICSVCGKESKTRAKMLNHMMIHAKLKPYGCTAQYCNYQCRVKSNLYKHMERVHKTLHPDKYRTYSFVKPITNLANIDLPEAGNPDLPQIMEDEYICAYDDCNFRAKSAEAVTKHQRRVHTEKPMQLVDVNFQMEYQLASDIPETFESVNIPVPVEEISEQTEAAHTLARLQTDLIVRTEDNCLQSIQDRLIKTDCEDVSVNQLQLMQFTEEPDTHVSYIQMEDNTIQSLVSIPEHVDGNEVVQYYSQHLVSNGDDVEYYQLEDGTIGQLEETQTEETGVKLEGLDEPISESGLDTTKPVYILQVEGGDGDVNSVTDNYIEMLTQSNTINFEPGTIIMNENGAILKII